MKKLKKLKITDLVIGIIFTLFFISVGVIITINFRPLYYWDVSTLNIEKISGLPKEEILENYNALIDYCSPFFKGELKFPTLDASRSGLQHFKEVKDIFIDFYIMAAITLCMVIAISIYKIRKKDLTYMPISALTAILLPAVIGVIILVNFEKTFILFHKIFFQNDLWLFNPITDPIINILPDTFFLHCALVIIFFVLIGSLILYVIYLVLKKRTGIKYRKLKGLKV